MTDTPEPQRRDYTKHALLPFQTRVASWLLDCFGPKIALDRTERAHRFLEEALEMVQAGNCTRDEAHQLVDYVFLRPTGEMRQEIGGTLVTLAAFCDAYGIDMAECGDVELARCYQHIHAIRAKQKQKPQFGPLP